MIYCLSLFFVHLKGRTYLVLRWKLFWEKENINVLDVLDSNFWKNYRNGKIKKWSPSGGLEPPTFRLTVERASQLRHEGSVMGWPVTKKKEYFS